MPSASVISFVGYLTFLDEFLLWFERLDLIDLPVFYPFYLSTNDVLLLILKVLFSFLVLFKEIDFFELMVLIEIHDIFGDFLYLVL